MRAIAIHHPSPGPDAWQPIELPDPSPGPGQVVVRVRAASLNYRDLMVVRGQYGGTPKPDLIALSDAAGEIVATGPGAKRWRTGDRVCGAFFPTWLAGPFAAADHPQALGAGQTDGVLAQYITLPETGVVRAPDHLSYEEAAALPCAAVTAWNALFDSSRGPAQLPPGASVLVQGTGGVAMFAAQLAHAAGLRVIGTSSSPAKAARLREAGADEVIDYRARPEWQRDVRELTGGEGVDLVIELGGPGTLARSIEAVKPGGRIALIGVLTGTAGAVDPMPLLFKTARIEGVLVGSVHSFTEMNRAIARAGLRPVIDQVFAFDRARDALAHLEAARHVGKIVVRVD
jgi:NADPH:quinone reductase-like Zn-dependent oxidoreductase